MYIVIMGGGRVGLSLADRLIIHGYDVTIIESDDNLCDQASEELDAMIICGNGTDTRNRKGSGSRSGHEGHTDLRACGLRGLRHQS